MSFFDIKNSLFKYLKYIVLGVIFLISSLLIFISCENEQIEHNEVESNLALNDTEIVEEVSLPAENKIKVDIKGAVNNPGVYELTSGNIVNDAINISGGLSSDADTSYINLSKKLTDEMVIIIYTTDEINSMREGNVTIKYIDKECICPSINNDACLDDNVITNSEKDNNLEEDNFLISINTSDIDLLQTLPGIGESKAKAIVKYREDNGNFNSIEEITNVSGIGNSIFEKIKDYITI